MARIIESLTALLDSQVTHALKSSIHNNGDLQCNETWEAA